MTHAPLGLSDKPATYVVEVTGDPITVADAATDSTMTDPQKQDRRSQLRQAQAPVADRVRELGGSVVGSYQNAYNGLKVQMTPGQAAAVSATQGVVAVHRVVPMKGANTC